MKKHHRFRTTFSLTVAVLMLALIISGILSSCATSGGLVSGEVLETSSTSITFNATITTHVRGEWVYVTENKGPEHIYRILDGSLEMVGTFDLGEMGIADIERSSDGTLLFIATGTGHRFVVVDVTNPSKPEPLYAITMPNTGMALNVEVLPMGDEDLVFLLDQATGLYRLDITDRSAPVVYPYTEQGVPFATVTTFDDRKEPVSGRWGNRKYNRLAQLGGRLMVGTNVTKAWSDQRYLLFSPLLLADPDLGPVLFSMAMAEKDVRSAVDQLPSQMRSSFEATGDALLYEAVDLPTDTSTDLIPALNGLVTITVGKSLSSNARITVLHSDGGAIDANTVLMGDLADPQYLTGKGDPIYRIEVKGKEKITGNGEIVVFRVWDKVREKRTTYGILDYRTPKDPKVHFIREDSSYFRDIDMTGNQVLVGADSTLYMYDIAWLYQWIDGR